MSRANHSIRLRPPWDVHNDTAKRRLARRFAQPTNLEPGQRVWLVVQCALAPTPSPTGIVAAMNGHSLGAFDAAEHQQSRWEIAELLQARNELTLEYDGAD